mmetsp:Transcript_14648/g.19227  ORF Transcript_14648/g.19227 Transcript_14648/m.19227 type:complete len:214 (-) Transcript_14648:717-1358(-)
MESQVRGNNCQNDSYSANTGTEVEGESATKIRKTMKLSRINSLTIQRDLTKIFDFLYLGAKAASVDSVTLKTLGITHIVNCTEDAQNHFEKEGLTYLTVPIKDDPSCDISVYFNSSAEFIENARLKNGKIFVHCNVGMSRSSTIVVSYLMRHKQMDLIEALGYTKNKRPMSSPNSGFMKQLLELEKELYGKETVDLDRYKLDRFQDVEAYAKT